LKKLLLLLLIVAAAAILWAVIRRREPPPMNFARVRRQTLVSALPTNGKVEPYEWQAVRAETAGLAGRVPVHDGESVPAGAELAVMTDPSLQSAIQAAQARVAEARANLAALEAGGRPAEITDIENSLARTRLEAEQQQREYDTLRRLEEKQAATRADVEAAGEKLRLNKLTVQGLEKRRASLIARPEVDAAAARVQDAETALALARERATRGVVRSPLAGVVYGLAARPGAWLNPGDLVANIGRLDRVRVRVYVDEPELGRVAVGQPVTITWQALAGRKWEGTVERKPVSIQALGSRQVGEVVCTIGNPGRELLPGTNVDAEIRTAVVDNALVIPRETLRHDAGGDYVLTLQGDALERRAVKTGIATVTQVQAVEGLAQGDPVALPSDLALKPGDRVHPVFPGPA
jgi:HlyD family secretion protein